MYTDIAYICAISQNRCKTLLLLASISSLNYLKVHMQFKTKSQLNVIEMKSLIYQLKCKRTNVECQIKLLYVFGCGNTHLVLTLHLCKKILYKEKCFASIRFRLAR